MTRISCRKQLELFAEAEETEELSLDDVRGTLDELYHYAGKFRTGQEFLDLLRFVSRFHFYSPYNAMLIHTQRPGAKFAATPKRWWERYGYRVKAAANPITILRPMGPVMWVYDASDVEPGPNPKPLPKYVTDPFAVRAGSVGQELDCTIENARRDGVLVSDHVAGSQRGGSIEEAVPGHYITVSTDNRQMIDVPRRYELLISTNLSREAKYATLTHELGHLYCGHLGSPNEKWWPDRRTLSHASREFEAESVSHIVCGRLGIDDPADEYLSRYLVEGRTLPPISIETVFKAAHLIEKMGKKRLPPRKEED